MIAPRRTRLHRAADPAAFRLAIAQLVHAVPPLARQDAFVLVPNAAAGEQLRRSLEQALLSESGVFVPPRIGPQAALLDDWQRRLPASVRRLDAFEREVLLAAAARGAEAGGAPAPFRLRPALVAEMLAFYDALRRQRRTVTRFEEYLCEELGRDAEFDRGAARLLQQTRFLTAAFAGYEARVAALGAEDEHGLRERLRDTPSPTPLQALIVTTGDRLSDASGLWPADFDLITRVPGLATIDVVATERQLGAGLLERLHDALPGIEEVTVEAPPSGRPWLQVPSAEIHWFLSRDREEELAGLTRRLKQAHRDGRLPASSRVAVVVQRPLPYLYLARDVFGRAGLPYEALDTLPLAAEPPAAALDLLFECATTQASRTSLVALLRSPLIAVPGALVPAASIGAFDRALAEARYLGDVERLAALVVEWEAGSAPSDRRRSREAIRREAALPAARAALAVARQLQPLMGTGPAVAQIDALIACVHRTTPVAADEDADDSRWRRVQAAIVQALVQLREAYARHDPDASLDGATLAAAVRRWLGARTFAPRTGEGGIQLLEASAAPFADVDDVHVLGLVDGDWPERERRSIFYPALLLGNLGWPDERGRLAAARAAFLDLLHLPTTRVSLSTITLEDDALVEPSTLLDEVATAGLVPQVEPVPAVAPRVFPWEGLAIAPVETGGLEPQAAAWAAVRTTTAAGGRSWSPGAAGAWIPPRLSVSRIERYLECPFRFFASEVLELEELAEDEDGPSALERGRVLHGIFESFFREWQRDGRGAIGRAELEDARTRFRAVAEATLETLPPAEATIERLRLFGSGASSGIVDRVLVYEAERDVPVVERLLELSLDGTYTFTAADGRTRTLSLRGKPDRLDLTADGRLFVIDYKSRHVPNVRRALQLPIYAFCATEHLRRTRQRSFALADAVYLSGEGPKTVTPLAKTPAQLAERLADAQTRLIDALEQMEQGQFPPRPHEPRLCGHCDFASVCRRALTSDDAEVTDEPTAETTAGARDGG